MGYALTMIRSDEADVMIAGGAEAPIIPQIWGTFCQAKVMSTFLGEPREAMKPFDIARSGFVLGEGAAFVVMEELGHAIARGARIYAEVLGHGRACEAFHPVAPEPHGVGVFKSMGHALEKNKIDPGEIDYINAHGTATEANDLVETRAIKRFFGKDARRIAISSTKPVTGISWLPPGRSRPSSRRSLSITRSSRRLRICACLIPNVISTLCRSIPGRIRSASR